MWCKHCRTTKLLVVFSCKYVQHWESWLRDELIIRIDFWLSHTSNLMWNYMRLGCKPDIKNSRRHNCYKTMIPFFQSKYFFQYLLLCSIVSGRLNKICLTFYGRYIWKIHSVVSDILRNIWKNVNGTPDAMSCVPSKWCPWGDTLTLNTTYWLGHLHNCFDPSITLLLFFPLPTLDLIHWWPTVLKLRWM